MLKHSEFEFFSFLEVTHAAAKRWLETDSNRRHEDFQSSALPTELSSLFSFASPQYGVDIHSRKRKLVFLISSAIKSCHYYTFSMRNSVYFFIFGLTCLCLNAWAVELVEPPRVQVDGISVTISWKTNVECGTRASYGLSPDKFDQRIDGPVSLLHVVRLEKLQKDTQYFYRVGSAKVWLHTGNFTTSTETRSGSEKVREQKTIPSTPPLALKSKTPPARETWGNINTLQDHYDRHGQDFKAISPEDYARQAWEFLQRAKTEGLAVKQDESDGSLRVYDFKTRAFAAYNRNGTTKTYFKPSSSDYWQRQPGKVVRLMPQSSP